jgi:DNA-binding NtrC family response regulator
MSETIGVDPTPRRKEFSNISLFYVVDDTRIMASTLAAILQMNGLAGRFFFDPLEALDAAKAEEPDLLISDVVMPGLSGVELAIRMKKICPACKVLLFSGQAETANVLQAAREQGYDFQLIPKPVHPADLLSKIEGLSP